MLLGGEEAPREQHRRKGGRCIKAKEEGRRRRSESGSNRIGARAEAEAEKGEENGPSSCGGARCWRALSPERTAALARTSGKRGAVRRDRVVSRARSFVRRCSPLFPRPPHSPPHAHAQADAGAGTTPHDTAPRIGAGMRRRRLQPAACETRMQAPARCMRRSSHLRRPPAMMLHLPLPLRLSPLPLHSCTILMPRPFVMRLLRLLLLWLPVVFVFTVS